MQGMSRATGICLALFACALGSGSCSGSNDPPSAEGDPSLCGTIQDAAGTWATGALGAAAGPTQGSVCVAPGETLQTYEYAVVTNYCNVKEFLANPNGTAGSGCPVVAAHPSYIQAYYCDSTYGACDASGCASGANSLPTANNFFLAPASVTPNLNADGPTAASEQAIMPFVKKADGTTIQVDGWAAVPTAMRGGYAEVGGNNNWYTPTGMSMSFPPTCQTANLAYSQGVTQGGICYELTANGQTVTVAVMDVCGGISTPGTPECCMDATCSQTVVGENCDWCHQNQHAHFDLTNGAFNTICPGAAGHCVLTNVTPIRCAFVSSPPL